MKDILFKMKYFVKSENTLKATKFAYLFAH